MGCPPANLAISAIVDRRGARWTPRRGWSRPGRAPIDSIVHTNMKIVRHGYLFVRGGGGDSRSTSIRIHTMVLIKIKLFPPPSSWQLMRSERFGSRTTAWGQGPGLPPKPPKSSQPACDAGSRNPSVVFVTTFI
jgi:hypothetical protein